MSISPPALDAFAAKTGLSAPLRQGQTGSPIPLDSDASLPLWSIQISPMTAAPRVHLIFKTHLDIGFTDLAERVRAQYHAQFIPQAIATGEHFHAENPDEPAFIWTTGAWLIWDHLETGTPDQRRRLERAIGRGLITWHALPFTTHTELMSPALFRAGLSFSQELDTRFGRQTTAAKMTDVPGHTLGMVPLLAEAGVRFLHLGVNTASPVPDVPPVFRWRAPDGSEIVVMYQASYGATDFPEGAGAGLAFAHTNDNMGPQTVPQVAEVWRDLRREMPEAGIRASTLDAFGEALWDRRESFPVVTDEIGDSWIHGAASDPVKLARFRALQRLYDGFTEDLTPARLSFGRDLTLVAEHTWGVDIKSYLRDSSAWDRPAFEALRASDYRFGFAERSWDEQRGYLVSAVARLAPPDRVLAEATLAATDPPSSDGALSDGGWSARFARSTGDVVEITTPSGVRLTGQDGALFAFRHETYDAGEIRRHMNSYLMHGEDWAILDHGKPGLETARTARCAVWAPERARSGFTMPEQARRDLGAPESIGYTLCADGDALILTLTLRGKPSNRMPEAGFLHVTPAGASGWQVRKMGLWHESYVRRGGARLQAAEAVRSCGGALSLTIELIDAALVAPVAGGFMPYLPEGPDWSQGLRVNLYNNKWGTNFPMWWEGQTRFRFRLACLSDASADMTSGTDRTTAA
jgi:hypothetical protein